LWALERDRDFTSKIFFCCVVSRGDKKFSLEKFSCEDLVICIYLRSFLLCLLQHLTSEEATSETMPFCDVGEYASDVDGAGIDMKTGLEEGCSVQLYYQLFGHGPTKVLLIPGVCVAFLLFSPVKVNKIIIITVCFISFSISIRLPPAAAGKLSSRTSIR